MLLLPKIEEYTDILTFREIDKIYLTLISDTFPWFSIGGKTVNEFWHAAEKDELTKEYLQLVHQFNLIDGTPNSDYTGMTDHILNRFLEATGYKLKKLGKVKANFQPRVETFGENCYNTPHVDSADSHYVLLYYPHTTDGKTRIFNKTEQDKRIKYDIIKETSPEAGKFLFFNGSYFHAGAHPMTSENRIVINFNFEIE
jgi:hypothetical protein